MTRVILVLLLFATPAVAQTPLSLTLEDAIQRATSRNPRVAEAQAREAAARSLVTARQALARPTLTGSAAYMRTNHVEAFGVAQPDGRLLILFPDIPDNYRVRAEMAIPLYTGGRVTAQVASAEADLRAAEADRRTVEADVRLETTRAYWTLVTSRGQVQVLEQTLTRNDAWVRDVRARVDTGLLPPNDVLSAEAQRARQSVRFVRARQDAALAEMTLARLIGESPGVATITTATEVAEADPAIAALTEAAVESLIARARESRSERAALIDRANAAKSGADAAASARSPQIAGLAAIEPSRPNVRFFPRTDRWRTSWDLGVSVTWPVWDAGRSRAEEAAALAQVDALQQRVREFDDIVAVEVRDRVMAIGTSREALVASQQAVAAASEARRVIEERFAAGVATSTEVLDAQLAQLEAELERTELSAALRLAEARLRRTVEGR